MEERQPVIQRVALTKRTENIILLVGLLAFLVLLYLTGKPRTQFFTYSLLFFGLMMLSLYDIQYAILPDRLNFVLGFAGILLMFGGYLATFSEALIGAGIGFLFLLLLRLLSRGGLGLGDVKLGFVLGLWLGYRLLIVALLAAFFIGGAVGLVLLLSGKLTRKDAFPFGPFLALGAALAMLFGTELIGWYQGLL